MQRILVSFFLICAGYMTSAQILQPAKIAASPSRSEARIGDQVELIFKATIDKNWYIYSLGFDPECGPIPISITLQKNSGFELLGELRAINDKKKHDKIFDCDVNIFEGTGEFRQSIRILTSDVKLDGAYEGQVCSETEGKCVLFDGDFTIAGLKIFGASEKPLVRATNDTTKSSTLNTIRGTWNLEPATFSGPVLDKSILEGAPNFEEGTLWGTVALAFILGIWGLLTPCVFPMIPMTVSFFLRDNQPRKEGIRNALLFGLSIICLFTIAGATFAVTLGPEGLNALATHWAPNLFVFLIFIVFALSFFGLFEINAPYQLVNAADRRAEKGGFVGIFFMAVTLVLVSFSCTIPIVGTALFLFNSGQVLTPILTMFSYSLAFALPFTLFALFPEWIKSLPKSGGWLNAVKVTFGFLELALALKFFSIADQAYHWGLLDRDLNITIWVVIFTLMGFYFLGKLPMKGDSPVEKLSVSRLLLATLTFSFVVYIIPGLWGAPLKALAGYLPPMYTHDFNLLASSKETSNAICDEPKYAEFLHLPHGLSGYFDYKQALACARQQDKPIFIDFTGHGCTNCREMEAAVWSAPQVLERLKRDFVVVALYVDDKTELPESEWFTSKYDNKVKKTIGKQNADLQIANLENNAQPFYILLGKDERVLAWPYGYERNVEKFVQFLDLGKRKYKEVYQ